MDSAFSDIMALGLIWLIWEFYTYSVSNFTGHCKHSGNPNSKKVSESISTNNSSFVAIKQRIDSFVFSQNNQKNNQWWWQRSWNNSELWGDHITCDMDLLQFRDLYNKRDSMGSDEHWFFVEHSAVFKNCLDKSTKWS